MLLFFLCVTVAFACWSLTALLIMCLWPLLRRAITHLPPALAADCLFVLEILPLLTSTAVITLFVVPGFAAWEPAHSAENINLWLAVPTLLSLAVLLRSLNVLRRELHISPSIPRHMPFVAVMGCLRPTLVVTQATHSVLNQEELTAVLKHETSHVCRRDNLRLLATRLIGLLTFNPASWCEMEAVRTRHSEFVADSAAVTDEASAVCLAEALVKMARRCSTTQYRFASSFAAASGELHERVLRLLAGPRRRTAFSSERILTLAAGAILAAILVAAFRHDVQYFCYQMMEKLVSL